MKKVLIVANNLCGGGAEKVLITLLRNIDYSSFQIDLVLIKNIGVYLNDIPSNVNLSWVLDCSKEEKKFPTDIQEIKKLYQATITKKYDLEIAFLEGPPTLFIACSYNYNSKKYAWVHVDLDAFHWTKKYYKDLNEEREIYLKMDKIIFVSRSNLISFKTKYSIKKDILVCYNPIDENEIRYKSKEFIVKKQRFRFCYVASMSYRKGQDKLILALHKLISCNFNCELVLVGLGEKQNEFINLVKKYHLQDYVIFTGFQKNPYPYIESSDVFVHASDSEGYPTVLCESLFLHKPIVATKCNGNTDVLKNGKYGLLVPISVDGLFYGMKKIMVSEKLRKKFTKRTYKWEGKFKLNKNIEKIEKLWGE